MATDKKPGLMDVFLRSDLEFAKEFSGGSPVWVEVWRSYSRPSMVDEETVPKPSEEQLQAIRDFLVAQELEEHHFKKTRDIGGLLFDLAAIRYTKKS